MEHLFCQHPLRSSNKQKKYYQTIFYLIFSLVGLKIEAEVKINKGRIDGVIIDKDVYIFEFKFNGDKNKALSQYLMSITLSGPRQLSWPVFLII
ncbi:MAG: PD-(D/E)XK nuclease domain-containing protein [Deltaproteobacteria bacterium]|nr:PD-(D/E)XK nuclease domain-containing protein [Deltaproteobacteria bacterium]